MAKVLLRPRTFFVLGLLLIGVSLYLSWDVRVYLQQEPVYVAERINWFATSMDPNLEPPALREPVLGTGTLTAYVQGILALVGSIFAVASVVMMFIPKKN